jgi:predicted XRE-type DNA-binding protein
MKSKSEWRSVKLKDEDVNGILHAATEGSLTQRQLAEVYGVTQAYISRIVNGKASRTVRRGE